MCKKLTYLTCVSLVLLACGGARAEVFSDDFSVAHDYIAAGVAGTGWDGTLGVGPGGKGSALNASISRAGQLYLESTGAAFAEPWDAMPPLLYKVVTGDFIATVKIR